MGDLHVTKYDQFWGEGAQKMPDMQPGEFQMPLGELEFLLDAEERERQQGQ